MKIIDAITTVITHIESDSRFTLSRNETRPPNNDLLASTENLPTILREFYRTNDGYTLQWYVTDTPTIRGGLNIPLLDAIDNTRWSGFGALDYTDDMHIIFQRNEENDSRVMAESLLGDEDIEFMDIAPSITTITEYFSAFEKSFGFRFWQENFNPSENYSLDSLIENQGYLWGSSPSSQTMSTPHSL